MSRPIPTSYLVPLALQYCRSLLDILRKASDSGSLQKLLEIDQPAHKDPTNVTRKIDGIAQRLAVQYFDAELGDAIERYGEEGKLLPSNIGRTKKTVLLIDPIDGTDLLARGFSNWCSALVFFHPDSETGKRILLTVVAHGMGLIYFATPKGAAVELPPRVKSVDKGSVKAWRKIMHRPQHKLKIRGETPTFNDASVCFYGQKATSMLSVARQPSLISRIEEIGRLTDAKKKEALPPPRFRIYNFGGNPMLAKIAEGTVDIVFSYRPCEPHDFVPGAFIAERAGAALSGIDGRPLSLEDILLIPSTRKGGYIVAASQQLANEAKQVLVPPAATDPLPITGSRSNP
jgi:fructose-1,6-bisphosphatase/inositol monophosphatase family enzyme